MRSFTAFSRWLAIFFVFIVMLIGFRIYYSESTRYIFLAWNIFLAWIPYILSNYFIVYQKRAKWRQVFLFASWLLFFPNALYIVTDLIHLEEGSSMPLWYDAILLFASSFVGLMMALVSLQKVENYLSQIFNRRSLVFIIPLILFISSFGVYLGRFQRWNSWDVIHNPLALGFDILARFIFPFEHIKTWGITTILTALYSLLYFFIKRLPHVTGEK